MTTAAKLEPCVSRVSLSVLRESIMGVIAGFPTNCTSLLPIMTQLAILDGMIWDVLH